MVTVTLHGALARIVGRAVWSLNVKSPAEALRAIEANTGKVLSYLFDNQQVSFRIVINNRDLHSEAELALQADTGLRSIDFMPLLQGAGNGGILAIIGLVLIAAVITIASFGAAVPAFGATGYFGAVGTAIAGNAALGIGLTLGISLTLSGISQLLYPSLSTDNKERPENRPSYLFNGAVNTYRQGNPIPVGFGGPLRIGSQVIAASVRSVDIPQTDP